MYVLNYTNVHYTYVHYTPNLIRSGVSIMQSVAPDSATFSFNWHTYRSHLKTRLHMAWIECKDHRAAGQLEAHLDAKDDGH